MKKQPYKIGDTYIFALVGDGAVKCFKGVYTTEKGKYYGYFDCGIDVRIDNINTVDTENIVFFNIADQRLNEYINCNLYIFSSEQKAKEMLVKGNLEEMRVKADALRTEYMKLADDCSSIESALDSLKEKKFKISKPFEK